MADRQTSHDDTIRRLATAAAWRVRLTEAGLESSAAFEAWLAEDPANEAAWRQVAAPWDRLGEHAADPEVMAARRQALARTGAQARGVSDTGGSRRAYRWSALAVAVIAIVAAAWWLALGPAEYRTALGERRVVTLQDGSKISLDSDSAVQVRYSADARHLTLLRGQARFDVAHGVRQPFSVDAGNRTVIATGTSFNIDLRASRVVVTLIEGHVLVTSRSSPIPLPALRATAAPSVPLVAGQALTASIDVPESSQVQMVKLDTVTSWESGRLVFDDETLEAAVERVARYADRPIEIVDERAAHLRLSGVFNAGDVATFVDTVSRYLPVRAASRDDGTIVLSSVPEPRN